MQRLARPGLPQGHGPTHTSDAHTRVDNSGHMYRLVSSWVRSRTWNEAWATADGNTSRQQSVSDSYQEIRAMAVRYTDRRFLHIIPI